MWVMRLSKHARLKSGLLSYKDRWIAKQPMKRFGTPVFACIVMVIIVMVLASIEPLDWSSYLLHQAGTVVFMAMVVICYRYLPVRVSSFIMATVFIIVHIIGARYLYSYVPYSDWSQSVFGWSIDEQFGWQRNMYDRLVHFCYGLLLFGLMYDVFKAWFKSASYSQLIFLVLLFNMATSALYELFEWSLAMTMSPADAEAYNGQQGDMWDAHKDMALALLGGIISAVLKILNAKTK